jgi:hypothetical protein
MEKSIYLARNGFYAYDNNGVLYLFHTKPQINKTADLAVFNAERSQYISDHLDDEHFAHIKNGECVEFVPMSEIENLKAEILASLADNPQINAVGCRAIIEKAFAKFGDKQ